MSVHRFSFRDPPNCPLYDLIKNRIKTVEGRKNSQAYQKIKVGDILILEDVKGELECVVTYIHPYHTVRGYLDGEGLDKTMPCVPTTDAAIGIYESFVSAAEIDELDKKYGYGFLGIGIRLITEHPKPMQKGGSFYALYISNKMAYLAIKNAN